MFYSSMITNTDIAGNIAHITAAGSRIFINLKPLFFLLFQPYFSIEMKSGGMLFKLYAEITFQELCSQRRLRLKAALN